MSYEPPTPPTDTPAELINSLNTCEVDELRDIAQYAEALAEHKAREARLDKDDDDDDPAEHTDNLPEDVPSKATITIKEINDNRYYYWQWREGDTVKSKYKAPVNPE